MQHIKFLLTGVLFGIVMAKAEIISWFRIYEMFKFESFHMYGIIGSALFLGIIMVQIIKRRKMSSFYGEAIHIPPKNMSVARYLIGGIIFGLGWALAGACPGPMFALLGAGFLPIMVVIVFALLGTFLYGLLRGRLPH